MRIKEVFLVIANVYGKLDGDETDDRERERGYGEGNGNLHNIICDVAHSTGRVGGEWIGLRIEIRKLKKKNVDKKKHL